MTEDLLKTLEKLRPDTHADKLWPQHIQVAERDRIMATSISPTVPEKRPRRVGTIVLVAAIATASGFGIAAAAGLMPKAFTDAYSGWQSWPDSGGVNPDSAKRIGSIPGPDGTVMSVFVVHGSDGWRCVTPVFESAADAEQPGPSAFTGLGDFCRPASDIGAFGAGSGGYVFPNGYTYDAAAGTAVRAELHTAAGEILPTVLAEGRFFGWFPAQAPGSPRPTLVGYAADGTVVGSTQGISPNF